MPFLNIIPCRFREDFYVMQQGIAVLVKVSPKQIESCYNNFIKESGKDRAGIIIVGLHEKDD